MEKKQQLSTLKDGARFVYGGVEWVKLEHLYTAPGKLETVAIAAEPVFEQAFDEGNCNDWRKSSLRRRLNGTFIEMLTAMGADPAAFMEFESNLTADDGMTDYGTARDKIALISCDLYREYRALIPKIGCWWWTLTPWTCAPEYSYYVRDVNAGGALNDDSAYGGSNGVRPLCHLESSIFVSIPDEDEEPRAQMNRGEAIEEARDAVLDTLNDYPADIWGDVLGAAVAALFQIKQDAADMAAEEKAVREMRATEAEPQQGEFEGLF